MMRGIPISAHSAIEVIVAPAIMAAPFLLGFDAGVTVLSVAIGAVLLGHGLKLGAPDRPVAVSAHAGIDYALAILCIAAGTGLAVGIGQWGPGSFLVGIGAAQAMLTAATRFSVPARP
jgi:hypothetical protein